MLVQYLEDRDGRSVVRLPNGSKTLVSHAALHPTIVEYCVPVERSDPAEIVPGDIYEDCQYHPVLCTIRDGDEVAGISLIDASQPRSCSISHCGVVRLEIAQVVDAVSPAKRRNPAE
jgi:hypothetical protein